MRNILLVLLVLVGLSAQAQNYSVNEPRMRVNRSTAIVLSTSWQSVVFNGTSTYNLNTYGKDPVSGNNMVWYDSTNNLFRFYGEYDKNISFQLFIRTTTTAISTGSMLQYRIVIPNGGGAGVDTYIPFPEDGGYADALAVTLVTLTTNNTAVPINLPIGPLIRTNGFYIQVRLSAAITLGTCTLNSISATIQSRY